MTAVVMLLNKPRKPATPASSGKEALTTLLNGKAMEKNKIESKMEAKAINFIKEELFTKSKPERKSLQKFELFRDGLIGLKYLLEMERVRKKVMPSRKA